MSFIEDLRKVIAAREAAEQAKQKALLPSEIQKQKLIEEQEREQARKLYLQRQEEERAAEIKPLQQYTQESHIETLLQQAADEFQTELKKKQVKDDFNYYPGDPRYGLWHNCYILFLEKKPLEQEPALIEVDVSEDGTIDICGNAGSTLSLDMWKEDPTIVESEFIRVLHDPAFYDAHPIGQSDHTCSSHSGPN